MVSVVAFVWVISVQPKVCKLTAAKYPEKHMKLKNKQCNWDVNSHDCFGYKGF